MSAPTSTSTSTSTSTTGGASAATSSDSVGLPSTAPSGLARVVLGVFVGVPLAALLVGVPVALAFGWVSWGALACLAVMYFLGVHGITVGYHRLFTHRGFKARRWFKIAAAVAGSLAVEGRLLDWVGDHRKHHQFSDRDGDPHSPWEFGSDVKGLTKGLVHAHVGWLFTYAGTDMRKYAPDIEADRDLRRVSSVWPLLALVSLSVPPVIGWLVGGPWVALEYFFWGSVVRVALVHHVTWSVNSVCHVFGTRPFASRDRSANVAWLAPISGGESWHSYHHADPTSPRHGVLPWQLDTSALFIAAAEKLGWVSDVKWPSAERIERFRVKG